MTNSPATEALSDQAAWDVPKDRQCLRCKTTFTSAWSGERICSHCKKSNAWRNGTPFKTRPAGNSR